MGARLARYTGNDTYAKRAEKAWDWMWDHNYIDHESWLAYDGAHVDKDCKDVNKATFSYNAGVLTQGLAFMHNYVSKVAASFGCTRTGSFGRRGTNVKQTKGDKKWETRLTGMLDATLENFFPDGVAVEVPCEGPKTCTPDMLSFKGYLHRWLAVISQVAPVTAPKILPILRKSTEAAVKQCTGGATGRQCGFYWSGGQFVDPNRDKTSGAGEAMNVLAAVSSLLIGESKVPVTNSTGGTSKGNPNAGGRDNGERPIKPITMADKVGAGILTFVLLGGATGMYVWMTVFD